MTPVTVECALCQSDAVEVDARSPFLCGQVRIVCEDDVVGGARL